MDHRLRVLLIGNGYLFFRGVVTRGHGFIIRQFDGRCQRRTRTEGKRLACLGFFGRYARGLDDHKFLGGEDIRQFLLYRVLCGAREYRLFAVDCDDAVEGRMTLTKAVELRGLLYFFECELPMAGEYLGGKLRLHLDFPALRIAGDFYVLCMLRHPASLSNLPPVVTSGMFENLSGTYRSAVF